MAYTKNTGKSKLQASQQAAYITTNYLNYNEFRFQNEKSLTFSGSHYFVGITILSLSNN
jgi:hypothetical protein